jgi:ABC-type transporter Mla subunit MlaD
MPVESHDDRVVKLELAALAGLKEGATREQLQDTLDRLRQFLHQVDARQFEPDDWALLTALIRAEMDEMT